MSSPSRWPLNSDAVRYILPKARLSTLRQSALAGRCYPLAAGFYPAAKNHSVTRESHTDHLLLYCVEGRGHLKTRHYDGPVRAGNIVLLRSGEAHHYRALKRQPWTIYWFHFAGDDSQALIDQILAGQQKGVLHHGNDPRLTADFRRLLALRESAESPLAFEHAAVLSQQILLYIALQQQAASRERHRSFDVSAVQALMQSRLQDDISLEALAAEVNLSKYHFSSKYRKLTGHSPIQHFIKMKMERACYLLDTRQDSVKTIAAELGYEDALYFSRQFHKVMGLSPSAYREQHKA